MKKIVKIFVLLFFTVIILSVGALTFFTSNLFLNNNLAFDKNLLIEKTAPIKLYDNNDNLIEVSSIISESVSLNELNDYVKNAFIAIEDKNFYKHNGLNVKRMAKALFTNLKNGYAKEGASTISQQLVKNIYLTNEKTFERKIKEVLLTLNLEKEFSKDKILEAYLNVIYFGNSSYGIESASKTYFNKSAKELTLEEAATLAGIIKSPLSYSPFYNLENSITRRNIVLQEMLEDGYINKEEYNTAVNKPMNIGEESSFHKINRVYEKAALEESANLLNLSEKDVAISNLKVFTYMDEDLQKECLTLVSNKEYYHKNEYGNIADSAVIVIDNKTGGINAFYGKSPYNLNNMKRSPGSAIKPILVYAPALEYGKISPITPILDEEITIGTYTPNNVGGKFYGWVSARNTVEKSLNIPAIKILDYVGIEKAKEFSKKAGIPFHEKDSGYSIALGGFTEGVSLVQLTNSYVPFANNGNFVKAHFVKRIETSDGKILYENKEEKQKIMSAETAYLMTDMLKSGVKYGTSHKLSTLPFEVAGKTGTVGLPNSNKNSDAWSVAYTKSKTACVWLGNSTGELEYQLDSANNGGTYASMLLKDVLEKVNMNKKETFDTPSGIVFKQIDLMDLKENNKVSLANSSTPEMYQLEEVFNEKYAPKTVSDNFKNLEKPVLTLNAVKNKNLLTFTASPYIIYELYRVQDNETTLLETIKDKKGLVTIKDEELEEEVLYEYYLIAKQVNNITGKVVVEEKSSSVRMLLQKEKQTIGDIIENIRKKQVEKLKEGKKKRRFAFFE